MRKMNKKVKSSKSPRKQRKRLFNAPLHVRNKIIVSHFSPELRKKYSRRSLRVRTGDKVKILRGQFKGKTGKVEKINSKKSRVFITGVEFTKKDGSKSLHPVHSSNVMINELNLSDKKRLRLKK